MAKKTKEEMEEEFEEDSAEESETSTKDSKKRKVEYTVQEKFAMNEIMKELQKEASTNEYFKSKLENKEKSIDMMWNYVVNQAKKKGSGKAIHSSEMVRWATDYYNDDVDNKDLKKQTGSSSIMLENSEEDEAYDELMTPEEIEKAKQEAYKKFAEKEYKKLEAKQKKEQEKAIEKEEKKKTESKKSYESLSLFDFN